MTKTGTAKPNTNRKMMYEVLLSVLLSQFTEQLQSPNKELNHDEFVLLPERERNNPNYNLNAEAESVFEERVLGSVA